MQSALVWIAIATAFAAFRIPFLDLPLERDEGEYAYIAQRWQAGDIPYLTVFDQKPPGVFLAYRAAFASFGATPASIHAFAHLWTALTLLALFSTARRIAGTSAAYWTAFVFAVSSADPKLTATAANTELFMLLPLVLSLAFLVAARERNNAWLWFASGAAAATACWFKPVAAVQVGLVLFYAIRSPRNTAAVILGGIASCLPWIGYFAAHAALVPLLDAALLHNLRYAQNVPWDVGVQKLLGFSIRWGPTIAVPAAFALLGLAAAWREPKYRVVALWLLASACGAAIGLYFRPHYFLQMVPALALLAGIGLSGALPRLGERIGRIPVGLAAGSMIALPVYLGNAPLFRAETPAEIARGIYGMNPFPESPGFGDRIARGSEPGESVYIVGSEPQILFYANRPSATRYIFFYPLTGNFEDALARQQTVVREIRASRPRYVVWVNLPTSLLVEPALWNAPRETHVFTESLDLLRSGYRIESLAIPEPPARYRELEGAVARRWFREHGGSPDRNAGVYLFRRNDRRP